ncbi:hypothetical protein GCM10023116_18460 [Kistimonas scapharcae]|uniref:Flagellar protein n=1 Tax=Kistimonas scapharcae TaxID=1036133 RepID=A0ABP8V118_9GAMM
MNNARYLLTPLLPLLTDIAQAAQETSKSATGYLVQIGLPLLLIIGMIVGFGLLAKRFNLHSVNNKGPVKVLSSTPVSGQVRLCLIEAGDKQLLISVSNQQANCLHVFDSPVVNHTEKETRDFATLFSLAIKPSQPQARTGDEP